MSSCQKRFGIFLTVFFFFLLMPFYAVPAKHRGAQGSAEYVRAFINQVTKARISEEELRDRKPAAEAYRNQRENWYKGEFPRISHYISYEMIVEGVCSARCRESWQASENRRRFEKVFVSLVSQVAYPKAHDFFKNIKDLTLKEPQSEGDGQVRINATALYRKSNHTYEPIAFDFYLRQSGDRWVISDFGVEGERLVSSWRDQINSILQKEGYASLMDRMEQKLERVLNNLAM